MAVLAFTDCYFELNSVDMSAYATNIELDLEGADLITTNFGSGGWEERIVGLGSGTVSVTFNDDFAASTVDDRLWALFRTVTTFAIRPTNAAVSATNPSFSGSVAVTELSPVSGAVGDLGTQDVSWPVSGVVARATS